MTYDFLAQNRSGLNYRAEVMVRDNGPGHLGVGHAHVAAEKLDDVPFGVALEVGGGLVWVTAVAVGAVYHLVRHGDDGEEGKLGVGRRWIWDWIMVSGCQGNRRVDLLGLYGAREEDICRCQWSIKRSIGVGGELFI